MTGMTIVGWLADAYDPIVSVLTIGIIGIGAAIMTAVMIPWCYHLQRGEKENGLLAVAS